MSSDNNNAGTTGQPASNNGSRRRSTVIASIVGGVCLVGGVAIGLGIGLTRNNDNNNSDSNGNFQTTARDDVPTTAEELESLNEDGFSGNVNFGEFGDIFENEDPFSNMNPDENAPRWENTNNNGLQLTILNALQADWHSYFNQSVADYGSGNNVLQLNATIVNPDMGCQPVDGHLKVCNGDYGATNWKGINQVLIQNDFIVASTAKMNDYYFPTENNDDNNNDNDVNIDSLKQYTMCHELGHGFGLGHTDEDFFNPNLGNCMDFANNVEGNLHPSDMNFEMLEQLYGTFDEVENEDNNNNERMTAAETSSTNNGGEETTSGDNTLLRRNLNYRSKIREQMMKDTETTDSFLRNINHKWTTNPQSNIRLLHQDSYTVSYEVEYSENWKIRYHLLLES